MTRAFCGTESLRLKEKFLVLRAGGLFVFRFALALLSFFLGGRRRGDFFALGARRLFYVAGDKKDKVQVKNYHRRRYDDYRIFQNAQNYRRHRRYFHTYSIGVLPRVVEQIPQYRYNKSVALGRWSSLGGKFY